MFHIQIIDKSPVRRFSITAAGRGLLLQTLCKILYKIKASEGMKLHLHLFHTYLSNSYIQKKKLKNLVDFLVSSARNMSLTVNERICACYYKPET